MVARAHRICNIRNDLCRSENLIATTVQVRAANPGFFLPDPGFSKCINGLFKIGFFVFSKIKKYKNYIFI